jgi:hypothetical protein
MQVILSRPRSRGLTVARNPTTPAGTSPGTELNPESSVTKGRPTPSRKEQEAARKRPLVVNDNAERRRREREAAAALREKQRIGLANGDQRYLPARDRGPQKKWVRDFVDARWSVGELVVPVVVIYLVASFIPNQPTVMPIAELSALWALLVIVAIDVFVLGRSVRKGLAAKFGSENVERGVRFYAAVRSVYLRVLRVPRPQAKRGEYPE